MKFLSNAYAGVAQLTLDAGESAVLSRGDVTAGENGDELSFHDTIARVEGPCVISLHTNAKD